MLQFKVTVDFLSMQFHKSKANNLKRNRQGTVRGKLDASNTVINIDTVHRESLFDISFEDHSLLCHMSEEAIFGFQLVHMVALINTRCMAKFISTYITGKVF